MMYKKALAKIGLNKGVLVGILFMLLVFGAIAISVQMVRGGEGPIKVVDVPNPANAENEMTPADAGAILGEAGGIKLNNVGGSTMNPANKEFTAKKGQVVKTEGMPPGTEIDGATGNVKLPNGQIAEGGNGATPISYNSLTGRLSGEVLKSPSEAVTAESPAANPAGMSCGQGGGGGDAGGGGKEGGLGALNDKVKEGLGIGPQAASALASIKDTLKKQDPAPNIFYPQDPSGEVTTTVDKGAVADVKDSSKTVTLAQNDKTLPGNIKGTTLKDFDSGNSVIVVYGSIDAILITPPNKVTHIINDLAKGNPSVTNIPSSTSSNSGVISFFLPFFRLIGFVDAASSDITGNAIIASPNQEIKLKGYDLGVSGEDLIVGVFKPFDKVNSQGTNLTVEDGNVDINFNNMKTYYPRLVLQTDYFINEIRNDYDTSNVYMLVPGGVKGNYFQDARYRLTVGDAVVKNPLPGYGNISIPLTRLKMWKKAADGDIIS